MLDLEFRQDLELWFSQTYLIIARNTRKTRWKWLASSWIHLPPSFSSFFLLLSPCSSSFLSKSHYFLSYLSVGREVLGGGEGLVCFVLFHQSCFNFLCTIKAITSCLAIPCAYGLVFLGSWPRSCFLGELTQLLKEAKLVPN